jgi:hypothetical protein
MCMRWRDLVSGVEAYRHAAVFARVYGEGPATCGNQIVLER